MKLCMDCKHYEKSVGSCIRPVPRIDVDYVYGTTTRALHRYATDERSINHGIDYCSPTGKHFKPIKADDVHQADVPFMTRFMYDQLLKKG